MVDVAQLVEPRIVIPVVAGSNPVIHPKFLRLRFKIKFFKFEKCFLKAYQFRSIAQPGSAPGLGPGGRRFESYCSDHLLWNKVGELIA